MAVNEHNGGTITISAAKREITLGISDEEMERRKSNWQPMAPRYRRGVLAKYAAQVSSASLGAVTDGERQG